MKQMSIHSNSHPPKQIPVCRCSPVVIIASECEKRGNLKQKIILSYVQHKILLNKGSVINFKVVKMDSLGPSDGHLKFMKCIDIHVYRNHKSLTSSPVKSTDMRSYPFLKSYHICTYPQLQYQRFEQNLTATVLRDLEIANFVDSVSLSLLFQSLYSCS